MTNSIASFVQVQTPAPAEGTVGGEGSAGITTAKGPASVPVPYSVNGEDQVVLSEGAGEVERLIELASMEPEIDSELVIRIKSEIEDGSYDVSPEDLARAIARVLKETYK